jgi:hypothetical protein
MIDRSFHRFFISVPWIPSHASSSSLVALQISIASITFLIHFGVLRPWISSILRRFLPSCFVSSVPTLIPSASFFRHASSPRRGQSAPNGLSLSWIALHRIDRTKVLFSLATRKASAFDASEKVRRPGFFRYTLWLGPLLAKAATDDYSLSRMYHGFCIYFLRRVALVF